MQTSAPPGTRLWLRLLAAPLILGGAVGIFGCIPSFVVAPAGDAGLRYRDEVFPQISVTTDLQYGSAPDLNNSPVALELDLYQPAGDAVSKRPAVIWVHGGGYSGGDKALGPSAILAAKFARLGYVAVSIKLSAARSPALRRRRRNRARVLQRGGGGARRAGSGALAARPCRHLRHRPGPDRHRG
jgi:hypothetical protein